MQEWKRIEDDYQLILKLGRKSMIENSEASTDNRNDRCKVKISKLDFIKKFYGIENSNIIIEEQTNKRGRVSFAANRMVFTSTVRTL